MGKWIEIKFSKIASLTKGISYVSSDYCNEGEGAIFITLKCIAKAGGFNKRGIKYYKGFIPKDALLKKGDLLFANTDLTRAGDIVGCPVYLPDFGNEYPVTMSMDLSRVDFIDENIDTSFIYYLMMTDAVRNFMRENSSGSTVLHLKTSKVLEYIFKIPEDKTEQTRIAQILSKTDEAITQTGALIAKYQRIKAGLMQDLLTRGIDEHGNIRSEKTHRFKTENGLRVPEEWTVQKLASYILKIDSGWSPLCESRPATLGEWGSLKTTSVTWEGYNANENKKLPDDLVPLSQIEVKFNDIIITRVGPRNRVGVVVHVDNSREKLMLSDNMLRLKMKFGKDIHPPMLPHILGSEAVQKVWRNQIAGLAEAQVVINQKAIEATIIPLPPYDEQKAIMERYEKIRMQLDINYSTQSKLQSLKIGLMQDLLAGKVRVNIKNEAHANIL